MFSPLDQFEVVSLLKLDIFNSSFSLTNLTFYIFLACLIILGLHLPTSNLIPSSWGVTLEASYMSINTMVKEQLGANGLTGEYYLPFIYSLFWFIIVSNLLGNIPYSFAAFTSAISAIGLSFIIFLGVTLLALDSHGLAFFSFFVPSGTPLALVPALVVVELISYLARAFSLGIRLFANLTAGHSLLKILASMLWPIINKGFFWLIITLLPFGLFIALTGLEVAVSLIQAYVFSILTCSYLKDAIDLH